MARGGRDVVSFLLAVMWAASLVTCFNLEPREGLLYSYPYAATQARESYFGFSVALQHNGASNSNWVMVGAPRANSSFYNPNQITEPGALFKCNLRGQSCEEVIVDKSGNTEVPNDNPEYRYQDLKNHGWLGGSLDSQPQLRDRQVTGVCAPRWTNQLYYSQNEEYMNGACYWIDDSDPAATHKKKLPLIYYRKQTKELGRGRYYYHYALGQAGMSIHFPDNYTEFVVGAPGVFNWRGSIILFKDFHWYNIGDIAKRRRRRQAEKQMFDTALVPDPTYISSIKDHDLFGYAVTSGKFLSQNQILYAGGAPRGAYSYGKVIVFGFPSSDSSDLLTEKELKGEQLGEYFGASLTAADINGDGLTDLVVGSPMFSLPNLPDVGRIQTFLSDMGNGLHIRPAPHYGREVSFARFGTALSSAGDLDADGYEDILVGAPWEGNGAVYVFLGSVNGLRQQYSQRLSPEDFTPGLRGFGMSMSRGIDIDNNGYPDLAIGSFLSGHAAVVKTRPVAILSAKVSANPSNVPWEGRVSLTLTTCLHYKGKNVPRQSAIQMLLTLDHGSPAPRALFTDNSFIQNFTEVLVANSRDPVCRTHQVTVKENKLDPDQPLDMKLEYDLVTSPNTPLIKRPMTNPGETHSSLTRVGILKGCKEKICKVDMMFDADLGLGQGKLVVGKNTKLVLSVKVHNSDEPAYLPSMNVTVGPPLTLILPQSHDCKFGDADLRTSLVCSLTNPIKNDKTETVEVNVDTSQLTDASSNPWIKVNVTGEGEELKPEDNQLFMSLPLEAHASLELHGDSKEEQVFYKHVGDNNINATVNPRFVHTYLLVKKGPTPLGRVDLTINIPINTTEGKKLVKLYPPKTDFLHQPFHCRLSSGSFDRDEGNQDSGIPSGQIDGGESHDVKPSIKPIIVSAEKGVTEGTEYFNCSSRLISCAQLSCYIYNWPVNIETAKITIELEVDLSVMAKHVSIKGGAVLMTSGTASIQSLRPQLAFIGERVASEDVVTLIQPDFLLGEGIAWWVILLAVLGGLLLLGLLAYGLYKTGFFKREKMEEMKAQKAEIMKNTGSSNSALVGD